MADILFKDEELSEDKSKIHLGRGISIKKPESYPQSQIVQLYRLGVFMKSVDLSDKTAKRLFVVELAELNVVKSKLADGLEISRQTIHHYLEIQKNFGREGLVHGYSSTKKSRLRDERKKYSKKRDFGNKAKEVAAIRDQIKEEKERLKHAGEQHLNFSFGDLSGNYVAHADISSSDGQDNDEILADESDNDKESQSLLSTRVEETIEFADAHDNKTVAPDDEFAETENESPVDDVSPRIETNSNGEEITGEPITQNNNSENDDAENGDNVVNSLGREETESSETSQMTAGMDLFSEEHGWHSSRYAGVFCYLICLLSDWKWLKLILGHFGKSYHIFTVFLLMSARNIRSIEHLKHIRLREAGLILGLKRLPSRTKIWTWFYSAARLNVSNCLLFDFFRYQIASGLVSVYSWFTDGHLLPYTGHEKVRDAFNTQRQMPEPGQTNQVTCDGSGRIADFEIQEGKGDLRGRISRLFKKWSFIVPESPVMVFDREGHGAAFFLGLIREKITFVTWEKHINKAELSAIDDKKFTHTFKMNGKEYAAFEGEKSFSAEREEAGEIKTCDFSLIRLYIWNKTTNSRTCGLSWSGKRHMSVEERICLILQRWGASENTFKHLQTRHPLHYHPGFSVSESENQEIVNPEIKKEQQRIQRTNKKLEKYYKMLAATKESLTKNGKPRKNSARQRLEKKIKELEAQRKSLQEEKGLLPEKVDVSSLSNYRTFKKIDNEGKNLFDFVTASVWNARKEMVDWLRPEFGREAELVDLFYAITYCHGWVKSTKTEVKVRLEPLQQSKRMQAQVQLCRKLTGRLAQLPNGKWLTIEVGKSPQSLKVSK